MELEVSFVPANLDDTDLIVSFMRKLRLADPAEGPLDEAAARTAIPALIANPQLGNIWIITQPGGPIGYLAITFGYSLEFGGRTAFIDELFIDQAQRRQGIGELALQFAENRAKAAGVRMLLLEVTAPNAVAKSLYVKSGFVDRQYQTMTRRVSES